MNDSAVMLYGANGYVGEPIARMAVEAGMRPVLAGRKADKIEPLAAELGVESRIFDLVDPQKIEGALTDVTVILHCAGPFIHTYGPMVEACLQTGAHYLDISGEIPVYAAIAARDAEARAKGVMLLPGAGFDVVPTDCLALHLKQRLPTATHLALAFRGEGPAGAPPGTQRTAIELIAYGGRVRRNGRLVIPEQAVVTRSVDFGKGPVTVTRLSVWADVFSAYYSTGIPNIEDYALLSKTTRKQLALLEKARPLFKLAFFRNLAKRTAVRPGPTAEERARTVSHVWGEVADDQGRKAVARLHGPEMGVVFTGQAALATVRRVLSGDIHPGYQTPALAFGADFVLECEGVIREDVD